MAVTDVTMDKIVSLCRRRGFVFPTSEIYGGLGSTYDYGHYGVLLRNNVKGEWGRGGVLRGDGHRGPGPADPPPPPPPGGAGAPGGVTHPPRALRPRPNRLPA